MQIFLVLSILTISLQPSSSQGEMPDDDMAIAEPSWILVTTISPSYSRQVVAEFEALQEPLGFPGHLAAEDAEKAGGDFDANLYFDVLDRISPQRGYVLDYVYRYAGIGGGPVLYARKAVAPPYRNYSEYAAAAASPDRRAEREDYYLRHLSADGSPESFFQLALLRIQGEQFYQYWHDAYNDARIVCDLEEARGSLRELTGWIGEDEATVERLLSDLAGYDLAPTVSMNRALVKVEAVVFTKWGGFIKRSILMEREAPHLILGEGSEVLVEYDCGILF
ncbi:hypothetical protein [Candidatus Methanocrinis natronophilus]|uniref:Uncharacterized protein n=1 Tax=Candidatus Methanocrinis natronophilus TaxID=3033396 RepID=A0ABT5XA67_9EURY|nr:hypothetical protein [Candidatus Methanocrinis natronophilus]MDF0591600.1 hypothetical protein [Candidatus Methanocrinis natronophilus]